MNPKPLERQLREAKARRPTIRQAVAAGAGFGIAFVVLKTAMYWLEIIVPGLQPPLPSAAPTLRRTIVELFLSVPVGIAIALVFVGLVRTWRRLLLLIR